MDLLGTTNPLQQCEQGIFRHNSPCNDNSNAYDPKLVIFAIVKSYSYNYLPETPMIDALNSLQFHKKQIKSKNLMNSEFSQS